MQVVPAINAPDFHKAEKLIKTASGFSDWIHIDVGDGKFSSIKTWDKPKEFKIMNQELRITRTEVHLMVVDPFNCAEAWLKAGVQRLIIHLETILSILDINRLRGEHEADLMLAIKPETPVESLWPYLDKFQFFQILAVDPGKAGQEFKSEVLEKIKLLRQKAPNAKIEVDGGINLETAGFCKAAGADIVVSASYLFNSEDPASRYRQLQSL